MLVSEIDALIDSLPVDPTKTLRDWVRTFNQAIPEILPRVFDDPTIQNTQLLPMLSAYFTHPSFGGLTEYANTLVLYLVERKPAEQHEKKKREVRQKEKEIETEEILTKQERILILGGSKSYTEIITKNKTEQGNLANALNTQLGSFGTLIGIDNMAELLKPAIEGFIKDPINAGTSLINDPLKNLQLDKLAYKQTFSGIRHTFNRCFSS
jgi:hypothetical protein